MINLPKKIGDKYVKLDKNGKPEYGFEVKYNKIITKFVNFTNSTPKVIILPIVNDKYVPTDERCLDSDLYHIGDYVDGNVEVANNCFKGIKNLKIVVPYNTSIMLNKDCFDKGTDIEFILPVNMSIKQVFRSYDNGVQYEKENWTLLADKRLKKDMGSWRNAYSIKNFSKEYNIDVNFKVNNEYYVENGQVIKNAKERE